MTNAAHSSPRPLTRYPGGGFNAALPLQPEAERARLARGLAGVLGREEARALLLLRAIGLGALLLVLADAAGAGIEFPGKRGPTPGWLVGAVTLALVLAIEGERAFWRVFSEPEPVEPLRLHVQGRRVEIGDDFSSTLDACRLRADGPRLVARCELTNRELGWPTTLAPDELAAVIRAYDDEVARLAR